MQSKNIFCDHYSIMNWRFMLRDGKGSTLNIAVLRVRRVFLNCKTYTQKQVRLSQWRHRGRDCEAFKCLLCLDSYIYFMQHNNQEGQPKYSLSIKLCSNSQIRDKTKLLFFKYNYDDIWPLYTTIQSLKKIMIQHFSISFVFLYIKN